MNAQETEYFEARTMRVPFSGCQIWTGCVDRHGYAVRQYRGEWTLAHRLVYELEHGPIPNGKQVLHTCHVRCCVNADHLYAGTHADNMRDMSLSGRAARLGAPPVGPICKRGHVRAVEQGPYGCRACDRERQRRARSSIFGGE